MAEATWPRPVGPETGAGLAAAGLLVIMLGAVTLHVSHDPLWHALPALAMGAMCVWVMRERRIVPRTAD